MTSTNPQFDRADVLQAAKATALWSTIVSEEDDIENLDEKYESADIAGEAEQELISLIDKFFEAAADLLADYPMDAEQIGHDIILTTNHHGAGFWDRGLGELGASLTAICEKLPEYNLYIGDDEKLYV